MSERVEGEEEDLYKWRAKKEKQLEKFCEEAFDPRTEHQKLRDGDVIDPVKLERERKEFLRGGNWSKRKGANDES